MTDSANQIKKPQDIVYRAKAEYAEMIAINIRKDIASQFGLPADVEVGGYPGDEVRPIKIHYFGSDNEMQRLTKYIDAHYCFGVEPGFQN
ncbi:hypothetical protein LOX61_01395 [Latilactobacillus curvatus]|uniref:hypothetical protein n=1 Tax=Latilactobacillus curvatus TaxID=28038 RepID=UPI0020C7F043|nr:hypothetical protein [Latilactobacillus curvatus]MCP8849157.1 hypothetical protein [Latilactobacillus curvatus]